MFVLQYTERGAYDVFRDGLPVARAYEMEKGVKIHMFHDDYEFECDSFSTAYPLMRIRLERPFCHN